jgi:branched-chain amino acid transport system substrate-binding protein
MKRLLRTVFLIFFGFVIVLNFIHCKRDVNEVKIGVIMPLTGGAAVYGVPSLNAIRLAVEKFENVSNQKDVKIKLVAEDSQANPAMGVTAIQKLIDVNRVKVILGPLASGVTLAVAPIAEKKKNLILSPSSSAPAITNAGAYIFRTELSDLQGGVAQADLAIDKLSFKKIACVYINNDYGASLIEVFKKRFEEKGGVIAFKEGFPQGATDFKTILSKITTAEIDAIFVISHDEILNFVRQKAEIGIHVPIYTTPVFEDQRNLEKLGSLANGIIYTYYGEFDPNSDKKIIKEFIQAYQSKYGEPPSYYAALAYDATNILLKALEMSNFKIEKLKDVLAETRNFIGVTGKMSFDKNGDILKPVSLKFVKDGKFLFYK